MMKYSLDPVIDKNSMILILGTMPGDESLRLGQYYANPNNQFWHILSQIYSQPISPNYDDRLLFLREKGLALWDVLKSAERAGSQDKNIRNAMPNDFASLFGMYSGLRAIAFNGGKAEEFFHRFVMKSQRNGGLRTLRFVPLPSTSPTPGKNVLPLEQKIAKWRIITTV